MDLRRHEARLGGRGREDLVALHRGRSVSVLRAVVESEDAMRFGGDDDRVLGPPGIVAKGAAGLVKPLLIEAKFVPFLTWTPFSFCLMASLI
jgi:hypothetical protein